MAHFEKKIDGEVVFQGNIIQVRHDRVELENGRIASREVVVHPGAVVMLAVQDGFAYLVRQYRYPFGRVLTELLAGFGFYSLYVPGPFDRFILLCLLTDQPAWTSRYLLRDPKLT